MPEIGTSGSMSGDRKRSVAAWPKLPRPSSTLPKWECRDVRSSAGYGDQRRKLGGDQVIVAIDPTGFWRFRPVVKWLAYPLAVG
jgi:hypothetical protein